MYCAWEYVQTDNQAAIAPLQRMVRVSPDDNRNRRREAPFAFAADAGGTGPLITGFLDVLAEEPDGSVLIVDYKSDRLEGPDRRSTSTPTTRPSARLRARRAAPWRAPVEVAYFFLERPEEPVVARSRGRRTGTGRASARARPRRPRRALAVTDAPHRDLCGDCPGRRALCSWPESMTLAAQSSGGLLRPAAAARRSRRGSSGERRRSTTALSSAPNSSTMLVSQIQTSRMTTPANAP